ncbi:hypothetical protein GCM10010246_10610 [Streptomyces cuspidosporus]|uniref:Ig-like domain-containing protein n=2 Tax=Streptomyces cuspidosporus TaxID=66882 RepID=A0ABN3FGB4_9ACTN
MHRRSMRLVAVAAIGLLALTGCGKKGRHSSGSGGFVSGGAGDAPLSTPSGLPTDLPTDLPSGVPSYTPGYTPSYTPSPSYSYSTAPSYDTDARNDISASGCDYNESTSSLEYTLTVNNNETQSMRFSISIVWNDNADQGLLGSDYQSVTVAPGSSQTVKATSYRTLYKATTFTCKVQSAYKFAN